MTRRRSEREQVQPGVRVIRSVHRAGNRLCDHRISLGIVQSFIPLPVADLGQIHTVAADILAVLHQLILHLLDEVCTAIAQLRQTAHRVDDQIKPVNVVEDPHIEGRGDGALLLVAADMEIFVVAAIGQLVDEGRIPVVGEDNGLILGEQTVIFLVGQTVGMLRVGLELHQIHHIYHAELQLRQLLTQDADGSQRFQRGCVAAAGHDHIRLLALIVGGPAPDADALCAVLHRLLHGQPLLAGVLAGHNDIHIVAALDAVVKAAQQAVGIRRQIHPHHIRFLIGHMVEETGVLVSEAVVILLPHIGGEDVVEGGDVVPPGQLAAHLQPLIE